MPSPYADAVSNALEAIGMYDAATGALVVSSFESALVLDASVGLRPAARHGFEVFAGYTLISVDGEVQTIFQFGLTWKKC